MNRKQALGTLHRLSVAYNHLLSLELFQSSEQTAFRQEVNEAFRVLAPSIPGKPELFWRTSLCAFCHEAYGTSLVATMQNPPYVMHHYTCASCLSSLLSQGVVIEVDNIPINA